MTRFICISARNRDGSPLEGGTLVLFVGTGMSASTAVTFGGVPATSVSIDPQTGGLLATSPPNAGGFVDLVLTNPDGQAATSANFHYAPPPAMSSFSPSIARKGDLVTVTGANFETVYGIQVVVGNQLATIDARSATQVVFTVPKLNQGVYQLAVTNFDGQYAVAPGLLTVR